MVAPRPLEPLVLYLAATPYSASTALLAVREERQVKGAPRQAKAEVARGQEGAAKASAMEGKAQQGGVTEAPEDTRVSRTLPLQDMSQSLQNPSLDSMPALIEHPVYFVSTILRDARARYPMPEKLLLALLVASHKLRHYFQGHPIKVVSAYPLERILRSPNLAGRVAEWNIGLQAFQLEFSTTRVIKGAALTDFVAEWTDAPTLEEREDRSTSPGSEAPDGWVMHFGGAFAHQGTGAGAVLISPTQDKLYYAVQLFFQHDEKVSNNITEYEGLIAGLKAAAALGVKGLTVRGDSQLLVNFSNKVYEPKDEHMEAHLVEVRKMEKQFSGLELQHVPRGTNKEADNIAQRASKRQPQELGVFEERLFKPSAAPPLSSTTQPWEEIPQPPAMGAPTCGPTFGARLLLALEPQEECWTKEFKEFLTHGTLPEKEEEAERVAQQATAYYIQDGELYRKRPNDVTLCCISSNQGRELLIDIHGGDCGHHLSSLNLVDKVFRSGFYWPTALNDAAELVKSCKACQFHAKQIHQPAQSLQTIPLTWPFKVWGAGYPRPIPSGVGGLPSPLCRHRQVHQVGGSGSRPYHPSRLCRQVHQGPHEPHRGPQPHHHR